MPITTRSGRKTGQAQSLTVRSARAAPAPKQKKSRRTIKAEMRKLREQLRTAMEAIADDEESDEAEDAIVVRVDSESSESEIESDSEIYTPPKRQTKKKQPQPSKPRALPTRARPTPKASVQAGPVLVTVPPSKDPRVAHIPLNDMLPYVNRPASVRQEERRAKPDTAGKGLNGFFLYRMAYHARIKEVQKMLNFGLMKKDRKINHNSTIAAQGWKLEDESIREYYKELSVIDEKNRVEAFADCPELIKRVGPKTLRGEKKAGRPFGSKHWAKPRRVVQSDVQEALPVGVIPGAKVTTESENIPMDLDIDIDLADILSPSAILPTVPSTPAATPVEEVVPLDLSFVQRFTGFYDPSEMKDVQERYAQIPRRVVYIDSMQDIAHEHTALVEDMSHLALDDHERDDSEESPVTPIQPEISYPDIETTVGFTEQLAEIDVDFAEAMANYEAILGEQGEHYH
ncbi:hypothetical protein QBC37DRAFT_451304 [Rhypophila decipiens]|uniref:HMG box domain-containing protein n=1 Tax=Rhypophila decipiens TaxID=261697 RepID=A0AAN6XYP3_9PEZI|nr:hypothetical protein QBC37DRAFT_451304 [Rhypophila decipiens]